MPAKHALHVALTESLVRHVRDQVAAGHHQTASDVVRTALEALMRRDGSSKQAVDSTVLERRHHG